MSLIHADGFDHWGTKANMYSNYYSFAAYYGDGNTLSTVNPRTGDYTMRISTSSRLVYTMQNAGLFTVGFGAGISFPNLPSENTNGWYVLDAGRNNLLWIGILTTGQLQVRRGRYDGEILGTTGLTVLTAGTYLWFECRVFLDPAHGTVEVRINGTSVILLTDVNTGNVKAQAISFGGDASNTNYMLFDDFVIWDTTGLYNNDFIGDCRCRTFFPNENGDLQDWGSTDVPAYAALDNVPSDPAHYISTPDIGAIAEFKKAPLPINTAYVTGVCMYSSASKSDAGSCEITPQIVSAGNVQDGTPINPGIGLGVYKSVFQVDPATGNPFSRASFDAMQFQLKRTA